MSYEPTNWKSGDVVTSAKLNKLENGVANAGGGGVLIVHMENGVLDKTWKEIHDAGVCFIAAEGSNSTSTRYVQIVEIVTNGSIYGVTAYDVGASQSVMFVTDNENGYPALYDQGGGDDQGGNNF